MDAVRYIKEKERLCNSTTCLECWFSHDWESVADSGSMFCEILESQSPKKAVEIVERWSCAHPVKTYMQKLVEKFPSTRIKDDIPDLCRITIYGGKCNHSTCTECWNEPIDIDEERQYEREV